LCYRQNAYRLRISTRFREYLCTILPSRVLVVAEVKSCRKDPIFLKDCGVAVMSFADDRAVCLSACVRMEVIGISMDLRGSHHCKAEHVDDSRLSVCSTFKPQNGQQEYIVQSNQESDRPGQACHAMIYRQFNQTSKECSAGRLMRRC
jgi:hypothetical protein